MATPGTRIEHVRWEKFSQTRMQPQVIDFVPILFTRNTSVGHTERRGIANLGTSPKIHHIVISILHR